MRAAKQKWIAFVTDKFTEDTYTIPLSVNLSHVEEYFKLDHKGKWLVGVQESKGFTISDLLDEFPSLQAYEHQLRKWPARGMPTGQNIAALVKKFGHEEAHSQLMSQTQSKLRDRAT